LSLTLQRRLPCRRRPDKEVFPWCGDAAELCYRNKTRKLRLDGAVCHMAPPFASAASPQEERGTLLLVGPRRAAVLRYGAER